MWISKVAKTLHPGVPHGPEVGGLWRNNSASIFHPHIHSPLPSDSTQRVPRPLPAHPRGDPKTGQLAGIPPGPVIPAPRADVGAGRASRSPRDPRAHKCVLEGLAHRYVDNAMYYACVVRMAIAAGSVFGETCHNWPAHIPQQNQFADGRRVVA